MYGSVLIVLAVAFFATLLAGPKIAKFLRLAGVVGIDQQKPNKPRLATSGGLIVAFGLLGGLMGYIGLNTFVLGGSTNLSLLLAASATVLIAILVGLLDDIGIRGELKRDVSGIREYRVGMRQWVKVLLTLPAAIPLMVVSAGDSLITIPFIGAVNVGVLYPLVLIPIAVVCVSNATNMLAGMNGLEAGLGFVASSFLGFYLLILGRFEGAIVAFALAGALLAFLPYNWFPAKILPGDSLTYLTGATFVTAVIIGNVEFFGIVIFIPWIIEALLKLRGRFKVASLGVLQKDGTLKSRYDKIYSLTHLVMRHGRFTEKQVASILIGAEIVICAAALLFLL